MPLPQETPSPREEEEKMLLRCGDHQPERGSTPGSQTWFTLRLRMLQAHQGVVVSPVQSQPHREGDRLRFAAIGKVCPLQNHLRHGRIGRHRSPTMDRLPGFPSSGRDQRPFPHVVGVRHHADKIGVRE